MTKELETLVTTVKPTSYECTITVDCAIFGFQDNELKILLVKRSVEPFKDYWMLPGGMMTEGMTMEESVSNVLNGLTGISNVHIEQVKCYSDVDRHPVKRVVTVCFYALVKPENHPVIAKNYVSDVVWHSFGAKTVFSERTGRCRKRPGARPRIGLVQPPNGNRDLGQTTQRHKPNKDIPDLESTTREKRWSTLP